MMKRQYTIYNICVLLALLFLGGGWNDAWGQYTITPQKDKDFPQKDIPTLVDTVYVRAGETRTLVIGNYEYYWYFRWYRKDGNTTTIDRIKPTSGGENYLATVTNAPSYFWYPEIGDFSNPSMYDRQKMHKHVASIEYTGNFTGTTGEVDSVFCDVSFNVDGLGIHPTGTDYTEPTIGKRFKFIIKPAEDMRKRMANLEGDEPMETIRIVVPEGAQNVNLQMDMKADSYFWGNNTNNPSQGYQFEYRVNNNGMYNSIEKDDDIMAPKSEKLITIAGPITTETTVTVRATSRYGYNNSPIIAEYKLIPQDNSDFMTEREINALEDNEKEKRTPDNYSNKYKDIGIVDFDFKNVIERSELSPYNNWRTDPLPSSNTSYSFADPTLSWISSDNYMPEDAYGLYRSANVNNISGNSDYPINIRDYDYEYEYGPWGRTDFSDISNYKKTYGWYANGVLYDRTYERSKGASCGYFYYVNASKEAGHVVTVPINGTLCAHTELTVIVWVADMASDNSTRPNFSLILRGKNTDNKSVILHRFSSGSMGGSDHATWNQLCYTIAVSEDITSYSDFSVEIYNNTEDSGGADYVIDDIRIYKSLPNIHVNRFTACDANTLTINTDYETILRNMGWTAGEEVQTSAERPNRYKQYGYGLPTTSGNKHYYGNVYFAFLEGLTDNVDGSCEAGNTDMTEKNANNESYLWYQRLNEEITPRVITNADQYRWVRVNRNLTNPSYQSVYSFRVGVTTNKRNIPDTEEEALELEKRWNFQAIIDFNNDTNKKQGKGEPDENDNNGWAYGRSDIDEIPNIIDIESDGNGGYNIIHRAGLISAGTFKAENIIMPENNDLYVELGEELYKYLQIPRIRCPWIATDENGEERLYLYEMDVRYTDMMFNGEYYRDENGELQTAPGKYHVMIFSGEQISQYPAPTSVQVAEIESACSLISPFTVTGRMVIKIEGDADVDARACLGSSYTISAGLLNTDDGSELENVNYSFDWFIGSMEEYNNWSVMYSGQELSLQEALAKFREVNRNYDEQNPDQSLADWNPTGESNIALKEALMELANNNKLKLDAKRFDLILRSEYIVAIPFVRGGNAESTLYCFDPQEAPIPEIESDVPELHPGFPTVQYLTDSEVALRLGHPNMDNTFTLEIPMRDGFKETMTGNSNYLKADAGTEVSLYSVPLDNPQVGEVVTLNIHKDATKATVTIKLNHANAKRYLEEGQSYELLIPFEQYENADDLEPLSSECNGMLSLPVKIVPEYLTWKGGATGVWYNDEGAWTISTKEELYNKDDVTNTAENVHSFSPLYFTKITIPGSEELPLYDEASQNSIEKNTPLDFGPSGMNIKGMTDNIQYDLAVYSKDGGTTISVEPYYGNLVSEIYFKPEALLKNQQHLEYQKAWVEFEMERGKKYWLASPLQDVFAGDMYAPQGTARQTTPAFTDIKYTDETPGYDRWNPAFYQKAWDKGITYYTNEDGTASANVSVVHSNWSIEYNNVDVPYALGKGFYASVEDFENDETSESGNPKALVRLPKADDRYDYIQSTKAASTIASRPNSGLLAKGDVTIILTDKDDTNMWGEDQGDNYIYYADGDGKHFLIGNPYMYPLDMEAFFKENKKEGSDEESIFEPKYWTFQDGTSTAVVGTPDVGFGENTGAISKLGQIAPMQAFFVELKTQLGDNEELEVKFTPSMMVEQATTRSVETKSYSATNPTLTITAERGETKSVAKLVTSDTADNGYEASEDAVVLLDSELDAPMVYTVSGSRAAQVNAMKEISNVGLGVYNEAGGEVTVAIEGMSQLTEPLYLYDAKTRKSVELVGDRYELTVDGESHGRYFLRSGLSTDNDRIHMGDDISIYSLRPGEIVATSAGSSLRSVRVYGIGGELVTQQSLANQSVYRLRVPGNAIYVVYAEDMDGIIRNVKLRVR